MTVGCKLLCYGNRVPACSYSWTVLRNLVAWRTDEGSSGCGRGELRQESAKPHLALTEQLPISHIGAAGDASIADPNYC